MSLKFMTNKSVKKLILNNTNNSIIFKSSNLNNHLNNNSIIINKSFFSSFSKLNLATPTKTTNENSFFGELTSNIDTTKGKLVPKQENKDVTESESKNVSSSSEGSNEDAIKYVLPENDLKLQKHLNQKPYKTVNSLLSPLKRKLYLENIKKNGFFINNEIIKLQDGSKYKLTLKKEEIEALEPSIYLRSFRIKSSVKKTNIVLRALKNLPLKKAITQLHFMHKKISRELVEMLEKGLEDAKLMNYNPNDIYISESWVCTDGRWQRRVECKGRGRTGIITHRYVNVRFLLKTNQTLKRLEFENNKRETNKKVNCNLTKEKIRGPAAGFYKW
ncbi:unnamed protein product [[Candida] boidinii]|uniref:Unnamed protein product n=1 Tax=Candida boidinii TaxID=5477 RepID=A0A9W6T563_CANBO|nr:hypothetical protein B5S30_g523 [[Candida] boidinii]GME75056.1 unnamed protein product [[Candida] boidinii]GMF97826.1 unnamed protein product [[Candida] boidinii]